MAEIPGKKWHESLADMIGVIGMAVVLTSPCWGLALYAWARGR
jgi:hypothetical protein